MHIDWSAPVSNTEAFRRAGGRRAYNRARQAAAIERRYRLVQLIQQYRISPWLDRGSRTRLARLLGVHKSTVTRDLLALDEDWRLRWRPRG